MATKQKIEKMPIPEFDSSEKAMVQGLIHIVIQDIIKGDLP